MKEQARSPVPVTAFYRHKPRIERQPTGKFCETVREELR